jgi:hypothetical protein
MAKTIALIKAITIITIKTIAVKPTFISTIAKTIISYKNTVYIRIEIRLTIIITMAVAL